MTSELAFFVQINNLNLLRAARGTLQRLDSGFNVGEFSLPRSSMAGVAVLVWQGWYRFRCLIRSVQPQAGIGLSENQQTPFYPSLFVLSVPLRPSVYVRLSVSPPLSLPAPL